MPNKNTFNFPVGTAFVIGGSGGIGKEICLHFAANKVPVIFTYQNNKDSAEKLIEEITSSGSLAEAIQLSLENRQDVLACFEKFKAENKKIHTIVNAAGSNIKMEWIGNLEFKDWDETMHADSTGFFNLVKSSLPWMRECQGSYIERLLTAAVGMCAEAGEFTEVIKKTVFQGKPVTEENLFHLKRELGDIMWYVMQACMGLDTTLDEIVEMNVEKLKARYPGGQFDVHYSENRKEGDL